MHLSTLPEWINWITNQHSRDIDLGLKRVGLIAIRLQVLPNRNSTIIVGGTNGKGSTVKTIETIYRLSGYQIGTFTSPFLLRINEEICINGKEVNDDVLCQAFSIVERYRGCIPLTSFEFRTLAALWIFKQYQLDIVLLEVGLGGRLDATNIVDAELAIVTNIDLDHTERLGYTKEEIALEKAGIFRPKQNVILGDISPPVSLINQAKKIGVTYFYQGKDFYYGFDKLNKNWNWWNQKIYYSNLPKPILAEQNISVALMAIDLNQKKWPVSLKTMIKALKTIVLIGRVQIKLDEITTIYDVSHNPASVALLANKIKKLTLPGSIHAVFSMLSDKNICASIANIKDSIQHWYVAPLSNKRGASKAQLKKSFKTVPLVNYYGHIIEAYEDAKRCAIPGDGILVFGSFCTVSEIIRYTEQIMCQ